MRPDVATTSVCMRAAARFTRSIMPCRAWGLRCRLKKTVRHLAGRSRERAASAFVVLVHSGVTRIVPPLPRIVAHALSPVRSGRCRSSICGPAASVTLASVLWRSSRRECSTSPPADHLLVPAIMASNSSVASQAIRRRTVFLSGIARVLPAHSTSATSCAET